MNVSVRLLLLGLLLFSGCAYPEQPGTFRPKTPPHTILRGGGGWAMTSERYDSLSAEQQAEFDAWFSAPKDLRGRWKTRFRPSPALRAFYRTLSRRPLTQQDQWWTNAPEDPLLYTLHSPWVRAVLHPIAGGAPARVYLRRGKGSVWSAHPWNGGSVVLRVPVKEQFFHLDSYTHEMGHLFENRDIDRALVNRVQARFEEQLRVAPGSYSATNPSEQFADAFMDAMKALRISWLAPYPHQCLEAMLRSTSPYRAVGTKDVADWLRQHPALRNHPLHRPRVDVPEGMLPCTGQQIEALPHGLGDARVRVP